MADSREFNPAASNWLVRAYYTPLGDAIHGRMSASLDVRREIGAAELPAPLSGLIYSVVRRSRLWRAEKMDVARELIAHFADGLSAGRSAEELARDFGSPEQAAKLIRRGKLRSRSLAWQCYHFLARVFLLSSVVALVFYSAMAARFYFSRPNIIHNYWQDINSARRVAEPDRAWPLYRAAALKLDKPVPADGWPLDGPAGELGAEVAAYVEHHRESIDLARQGAQKARLGYFAGDPADRQAARAANADWLMHDHAALADENRDLFQMNLGGIEALRSLAHLLVAGTHRAVSAGDGATVVADLSTLLSMSEQIDQPHASLVEQATAIGMFETALAAVGKILVQSPRVMSDSQCRDLAHRIAAYRGGTLSIDFSMERMMFDDLLQRMYTDDGHGDGHITPAGGVLLDSLTNDSPVQGLVPRPGHDQRAAALLLLIDPGVATLIGGRRENHDLYESAVNQVVRAHQGPAWQWDVEAIDAIQGRLFLLAEHPIQRLRYMPVLTLIPSFDGAYNKLGHAVQTRDAIEAAIALELWHRRHGDWPTSLEELVPDLLPELPADQYVGRPLRYLVRDGQPVIYSVGADRHDDGGHPNVPLPQDWANSGGVERLQSEASRQRPPTFWGAEVRGGYGRLTDEDLISLQERPGNRGDWILWPPVKEERQ